MTFKCNRPDTGELDFNGQGIARLGRLNAETPRFLAAARSAPFVQERWMALPLAPLMAPRGPGTPVSRSGAPRLVARGLHRQMLPQPGWRWR